MATDLQVVYDAFLSKIDEDMDGKESLIFETLKTAISQCYKTVRHLLTYTLTTDYESETDGSFTDTLDEDEIQLIAYAMKYVHMDRKLAGLLVLRRDVGTREFDRLPDKKREVDGLKESQKELYGFIKGLKDDFNTYIYT